MAFKKRRAGGEKRYWRENRANGQSPTIIAQHDTPNDYTVTFSKAFVRNGRQTSARLNRVERGHGGTDARLYRQLLVENFSGMFLENLDDFVAFRLLAFVRSKGIIFAVMFERFVLLFFFFSHSTATRRVAPRRNGLRKLKRKRTTHVVTIPRCTYGDCCVGIIKVQSPMTIITNIGRSVSNSVASPYTTQRLFIIVLIRVRRSRDRKFVIILINTAK